MYKQNDQGVALDNAKINADAQHARVIGYLSEANIDGLFKSQSDAVGIRVYEAMNRNLIAVCVNSDGFELPARLKSQAFNTDLRRSAMPPSTNDDFSSEVSDEPTSAFFSETMLNTALRQSMGNATGLAFLLLEGLTTKHFTGRQTVQIWEANNLLRSIMAVPVQLLNDGKLPANLSISAPMGIMSDMPCPGYCLSSPEDGKSAPFLSEYPHRTWRRER